MNTSFVDQDYMMSLLKDLDLDRVPAVEFIMKELSLAGMKMNMDGWMYGWMD